MLFIKCMVVQEQIRRDQVLVGNPLLNLTTTETEGTFKVKRRWDDDVVFKNCAKGTFVKYYTGFLDESLFLFTMMLILGQDEKKEANFINDAIRSEFHRKFMDRYIK